MAEAKRLLDDSIAYAALETGENPYGYGKAAERIVAILMNAIR